MNIVCVKKVIHELYGIPDAAAPQLINTKGGSIFHCPGVGFKSQQVGQECPIGKKNVGLVYGSANGTIFLNIRPASHSVLFIY